jgi:hypothetical protein
MGFAQQKDLQPSIQVAGSNKMVLHAYAKGVQIYVCLQDTTDTSRYVWSLKEPKASLYADTDYHHLIGKHYFDSAHHATWESTDGSKVTGIKIQQVNSNDNNAIPWLLLKATGNTGNGILTSATLIQRINTKGGKAPAKADKTLKGKTLAVDYTAEYVFYKAG